MKKILCLLLTVCMIVSMLPVAAVAEDPDVETKPVFSLSFGTNDAGDNVPSSKGYATLKMNAGDATKYYVTKAPTADAYKDNSILKATTDTTNWNMKVEYPADGIPTVTLKGAVIDCKYGLMFGGWNAANEGPVKLVVESDSIIAAEYSYQPTLSFRFKGDKGDAIIEGPGKLTVSSNYHCGENGKLGIVNCENANLNIQNKANLLVLGSEEWGCSHGITVNNGDLNIKGSTVKVVGYDDPKTTHYAGNDTGYTLNANAMYSGIAVYKTDENATNGNLNIEEGANVTVLASVCKNSTNSNCVVYVENKFNIKESTVEIAKIGKNVSNALLFDSLPTLEYADNAFSTLATKTKQPTFTPIDYDRDQYTKDGVVFPALNSIVDPYDPNTKLSTMTYFKVTPGGTGTLINGPFFTLNPDGESYSVYYNTESADGAVEIPATYDGKPVTAIGDSAFSGCTELTSVTIPSTVTTIGDSAFSGCSTLTSINIPDSMTTIGNYAFSGCSTLTSINIPDSVTTIGDSAFSGCSSLTSVNIPDSVTTIGGEAFYDCSSLTSVNIPDSVTTIGGSAFYNCSSLTSVNIPDSVSTIGDSAFSGCSSLTSVNIPDSVTTIGESAFQGCSSLTSVNIPNGVTEIDTNTFRDCSSLTSVTIPSSVTSIVYYAFTGCSGLTSITIPDSVTTIGREAFSGCSSLTNVTLGKGVTNIDSYAFNCPVKHVGYAGTQDQWNLINISYSNSNLTSAARHYNNSAYTVTSQDSCSYSILSCTECGVFKTSLNTEPNHSFTDGICSLCGANQTWRYSISNYNKTVSFNGYTGTESELTIPAEIEGLPVTSIGSSAFSGCSSLTSITIPDSVTTIGVSAFQGCSGLTGITIPDSVTTIGESAFQGCSGLTGITIPDSVKTIGREAFSGCSSLTSVTIPDSVTTIRDYAFYNCSSLTSVNIPDSVTSIGVQVFNYCKNLTNVTIGSGVTSIPFSAFRNCTSLESIVIPEGVKEILHHAFAGCTALSAVTVPATVTNVDEWAFYNCKNLDHVLYGGTQAQQKAMLIDGTNDTFLTATWHCSVDETSLRLSSRELCSAVALFDCDVCAATCWKAKDAPEHTFVNGKCTCCDLNEDFAWSYTISGTGVEITGYDAALGGSTPKIPETIEGLPVIAIGNRALIGCDSVTAVTIPETVQSVGYSAFRDCAALATIYFGGTQEQWEAIFVDSNNAPLVEALMKYLAELLAGDIDGNESVTTEDVIQLLLHVSMPDLFPISAEADFTGDNSVNTEDVIQLLLHVSMPDVFPLNIG